MNAIKLLIFGTFLIFSFQSNAQAYNSTSELEQISATLMDYIEGSTQGQPERLKKAFHPDLNLYSVRNDSLRIWAGTSYIEDTKEGEPTGEDGRILSIDYENNAAVAKVEISHPDYRGTYIDYFMLLKYEGKWTIVHKMYTLENSNKKVKESKN